MIRIRPQNRATDLEAICQINAAAFAEHGGTEAFDQFRSKRDDILSLVAETGGQLLGHVLFCPVTLETDTGSINGMGLGQLAVKPENQRQGLGTRLSQEGIRQLQQSACPYIIVIGHASYYPRFGFEQGRLHGIQCQWENVPADSFMVLILDQQHKDTFKGVASFDGM